MQQSKHSRGSLNAMTQLSQAECTAGISRAALQTINNRNGHRRRQPHVPDAPQPSTSAPDPVPELTHILLSHERQLDLINVNGFRFQLRRTAYQLNQVSAVTIHFTRPELERMHQVIGRILEETPERSEE